MKKSDWNYDRIHSAQSQVVDCQNDMMRCLHSGQVYDVVRERMCRMLRFAADDLERLKLSHEEQL